MFKKAKENKETTEETENLIEKKKPDKVKLILRILFAAAAIVAGVLAFTNSRGFFRSQGVLDIGGVAFENTATPSSNGDAADTGANDTGSVTIINVEDAKIDFTSRVNILLMGLDYRDWEADEEASRTDTMILVTLDPVAKTAGILSIPRDLWVNVPGFGQNKINTAYFLGEANRLPGGGPELAVKTVEEFLGIDVHYWAQVDFTAFVQFIDYIGGIKMTFTDPIRVEMIGGDKELIRPGRRTLNGALALAYARNRSEGDGDFDRARRQQQVIMAIREQLLRADVQRLLLTNPHGVWDIFSQGIHTNVPFDDALNLGMLALQINPQQITQYVIAPPNYVVHATSPDGLAILKPITQNIRLLRDDLFTPVGLVGPAAAGEDPLQLALEENASIGVYNGSSVSGLAGTTETYLKGQSLNIVEVGNWEYVPSTTVYDYTGNPYTLQYLITVMHIQPTRIISTYDPQSAVDVAIVVGNDWQVP